MINRTFENYKYFRTYIGDSKKQETILFRNVQGIKDDNSECDWFEYRRMINLYFNDILNVIFSWRILIEKFSLFFVIISILFAFYFIKFSLMLLTLSIILRITSFFIKKREINVMKNYDFCLTILLGEIKNRYGLEFPKNIE